MWQWHMWHNRDTFRYTITLRSVTYTMPRLSRRRNRAVQRWKIKFQVFFQMKVRKVSYGPSKFEYFENFEKKTLKLKIKLWLYACVLESNSKNPVLWSNRSEGDLVKCVLRARDITWPDHVTDHMTIWVVNPRLTAVLMINQVGFALCVTIYI